jgi:hypothetical protein
MNRDDVLRIAREAGGDHDDGVYLFMIDELERFAALVAAAEREACAELCDRLHEWDPPCADCGGEIRNRLRKRHAGSCSNQNVLKPDGAYEGAEECGCNND